MYLIPVTSLPDSRSLLSPPRGLLRARRRRARTGSPRRRAPFRRLHSACPPSPGRSGCGEDGAGPGTCARLSSGSRSASSERSDATAGQTSGSRAAGCGRRAGVDGVVGGFDYLAPRSACAGATPASGAFGFARLARHAAGEGRGTSVTPDVLLYAKAGGGPVRERLQFGATPFSLPFARADVAPRRRMRASGSMGRDRPPRSGRGRRRGEKGREATAAPWLRRAAPPGAPRARGPSFGTDARHRRVFAARHRRRFQNSRVSGRRAPRPAPPRKLSQAPRGGRFGLPARSHPLHDADPMRR